MLRAKLVILIVIPIVLVASTLVLSLVAAVRRTTGPVSDLRIYEPRAFESAADASKRFGIPIPPEAQNIRVASWSQWIAHEDYLRFEAPVSVCIRHALVLVPADVLAPIPVSQLALDAKLPQPGIFRDLSWFDLGAAQNVVGAGGGSQRPQVWVDQSRSVFYYRLTD